MSGASLPSTTLQSSYIAALQNRKAIDAPTCSMCLVDPEGNELTDSLCRPANLILALNQLVDALTGLERILTTPIPFSSVALYSQNS
jgi:hypothetical protein